MIPPGKSLKRTKLAPHYKSPMRLLRPNQSSDRKIIFYAFATIASIYANIYQASAQPREYFDASLLNTTWELITNVTQTDPRFHARLTISNKGSNTLPSSAWRIYFNLRYHSIQLKSTTPEFEIWHVNGELFSITPTKLFHGLGQGESIAIEYTGLRRIANFQDVPSGIFFTQDIAPDLALEIPNPAVGSREKLVYADAKRIYNENEGIKDIPFEKLPRIFPTPALCTEQKGIFVLDDRVTIDFDPYFQAAADFLRKELEEYIGPSVRSDVKAKTIRFKKDQMANEAYRLHIAPDGITITASDGAGAFYAIRSLQSLFPPDLWSRKEKVVNLPCLDVVDHPRFAIREFMLDVARNFQSKEQIMRILDVMSIYKLNTFHFHFSDDEGWRLQIPELPELTEVGAVRGYPFADGSRLQPSYGSGPEPLPAKGTGSGYYSRKDFMEILQYATQRHINVIPEIESPGHARAAIKAMEARYRKYHKDGNQVEAEKYLLTDLDDQSIYVSNQGFTDNVMNVALPSTYRFMEKVIDELILMYSEAGAPLTMIHMAGDEVPHGAWEKSPLINTYLQTNPNFKSGDDLWRNYFTKMKAFLGNRGLSLYGWEELVLGKQNANESRAVEYNEEFIKGNVLIDAWWNVGFEDMPYRMANMGYKVVMSCFDHLYFDLAQAPSFEEPGDAWAGYLDLSKVFAFSPYNYFRYTKTSMAGKPLPVGYFDGKEQLKEASKSNIVGLQAALWGENMTDPKFVEHMIMPRLLALSERAWAREASWELEQDAAKSASFYNDAWSVFVNRLGKMELPRLDYYHGGYGYYIPAPGAIRVRAEVLVNHQLPGMTLRYTTDGSQPSIESRLYTRPIKDNGTVKVAAFDHRGRASQAITVE